MSRAAPDWDLDELSDWLRLTTTPRVGRESVRKLLAAFGSPQQVLRAGAAARRGVVGPGPAAALDHPPQDFEQRLRATTEWLGAAAETPRALIALGDARYPAPLLETADPPLLLYAMGRLELLGAMSLAIVGSRNPTPQGCENARAFARDLSRSGLTIISGLALGIDGAAHEGALLGEGSTVAVVGTGVDQVYPRRHAELARRIARDGLLVSEYSLGTPPLAANFPARNRIIAGLTRGTLVVEAAMQSGSLITARLAAEAGREVFAIPGSIHVPQARGGHALIKQGAKLVETSRDVLDELGVATRSKEPPAPPPEPSDPLLQALGTDPMSLDELVARTGRSVADLSARLLDLELSGAVARLPGQRFQRIARG